MTNTNMLRNYISKSGYKTSFILEQLGISRQAFLNKINNKVDFKQREILILSEILRIDAATRDKIFFDLNVDN